MLNRARAFWERLNEPVHFTLGCTWRLSIMQQAYRHPRCWKFLDSDVRYRASGYRNYFRLMWKCIDFECQW